MAAHWWDRLDTRSRAILDTWDALAEQYHSDELVYQVRGKEIRQPLKRTTLSGTKVPRVPTKRHCFRGHRSTPTKSAKEAGGG